MDAMTGTHDLPAPSAPAPAQTPLQMLANAVERGATVDVLEKLMELQERWEAQQARKAFVEAFAAFKKEAITIVRNKTYNDGPLRGKSYADLFSFVSAVTPALANHGLSASWTITRDEKDWIEVSCVIEHALGHYRRVSLGGPPDSGGAKNPLQARISTVTYLERQTLKAACGLAERDDDDDGAAAGAPTISGEQGDALIVMCNEVGADIGKLCRYLGVDRLSELPASRYADAVAALESKRAKAAAARKPVEPS